MISYKRDVLERQSLSEVKIGRGSPICERVRKKIVEHFAIWHWGMLFLKVLEISSSTVHNIIKRFRETGDISLRKGQGQSLFFGCPWSPGRRRHCITHRHYSVIDITMSQGILPEITVSKHNPLCHLQMPTKALSCKKEATCEHVPEAPLCPVSQGSFKMDCFKVEKCSMVRRVQIWHSCWKSGTPCPPGLKRRETFQGVISIQKSASLMVRGCISA